MIIIARKTEKISFRVTPKELNKIQNKAQKSNMIISEYLRYTSLNKDIVVIEGLKDFSKELKRIGNNLNQALILAHQGRIQNINLTSIQEKVNEIWQLLNSLTEKIKK